MSFWLWVVNIGESYVKLPCNSQVAENRLIMSLLYEVHPRVWAKRVNSSTPLHAVRSAFTCAVTKALVKALWNASVLKQAFLAPLNHFLSIRFWQCAQEPMDLSTRARCFFSKSAWRPSSATWGNKSFFFSSHWIRCVRLAKIYFLPLDTLLWSWETTLCDWIKRQRIAFLNWYVSILEIKGRKEEKITYHSHKQDKDANTMQQEPTFYMTRPRIPS